HVTAPRPLRRARRAPRAAEGVPAAARVPRRGLRARIVDRSRPHHRRDRAACIPGGPSRWLNFSGRFRRASRRVPASTRACATTGQVARAAELWVFDGVVVPYDTGVDGSWVIASALARETPRLGIVTEFPADLGTAVYAAKLALSFQRFFDNRLSWQIVLGG